MKQQKFWRRGGAPLRHGILPAINYVWSTSRNILQEGRPPRDIAIDSRLKKLQLALADATAGMSREEMGRHPEGKWCAGEILEHLYLTYTGTTKGFEKVVAAGKPAATPRTMKHRVYTFVSVSLGFFPTGRKSPERAQPRGLPSEQVQAEIGAKIAAMDAIITKCEAHFGRGAPILDHPILGALTAAQWRKFHLVHGLHHVKQIRRLRENGGN